MDDLILIARDIGTAVFLSFSYVNLPEQRIFWLYLLSAVMFAALLFISASKKGDRPLGLKAFIDFCIPEKVRRSASARLDLRFFVVGQTVHILMFTFLSATNVFLYAVTWQVGVLAFDWLPLEGWVAHQPGLFAILVMTLLSALFVDFALYCLHNLQHRWSVLWEFHKVHHSSTAMHPLTNYREHIIDNLLYAPVITIISGLIGGFFETLYPGNQRLQISIMSVPIVSFLYNFLGYNLRHSHVWLAWPPILGRIFGSPANHQIHHSREARHLNRNFGFTFALWDWMFGTLYLPPKEKETFEFGLADGTEHEYSSILRLYALPFVKLYRRYVPGRAAATIESE